MGLGLVFEVPMDAFQSAQLSDVFWLLQFCFVLLLDPVICGLSARLQPWPVCCLCEILGTNKEKPSSELAFAGINARQSHRWLEGRGCSLRQPVDHKCWQKRVFLACFCSALFKKEKNKSSRTGLAHSCLHKTAWPASADLPWWDRTKLGGFGSGAASVCPSVCKSSWNLTSSRPKKWKGRGGW